jgi:hypothetical protein
VQPVVPRAAPVVPSAASAASEIQPPSPPETAVLGAVASDDVRLALVGALAAAALATAEEDMEDESTVAAFAASSDVRSTHHGHYNRCKLNKWGSTPYRCHCGN